MITSKRNRKEYLAGVASGLVHLPKDELCKQNVIKIKSAIDDHSRPMVQAYWRGYKDGMENCWNFSSFYGLNK